MSRTNCEIIRDLLPLCAEGLASEASRKLIDEHLNQCPDCKKEMESIKQFDQVCKIDETKPLAHFRARMENRFFMLQSLLLTGLLWLVFMVRALMPHGNDTVDALSILGGLLCTLAAFFLFLCIALVLVRIFRKKETKISSKLIHGLLLSATIIIIIVLVFTYVMSLINFQIRTS